MAPSQHLILLGDFNAGVGLIQSAGPWYGTCGDNGIGETNDAGLELVQFFTCNSLTVCNTWFAKQRIHKYTWQHLRSKKWHCIDYAIVRRQDLLACTDCHIIRSAECSTDHTPVCLSFCLSYTVKFRTGVARRSRFNIQALMTRPGMTDEQSNAVQATRLQFATGVQHHLQSSGPADTVDAK